VKQPATYYHVKGCASRIQVHQGGTRSGKTYSILQSIVELCYENENAGAVITIARKTFPALRATAMRDFFEILEREDIYNPDLHNKSEANYVLFGNLVEFISVDQPQKVRGRKRQVLFINEANELSLEDWRQLLLRTTRKVIIDFNPSDEYHWIYEEVIPRTDASFFRTTYKDNPYLDKATIQEIERLKDADPNYWRIYGLGERGVNQAAVFTWEVGEIAGKRIGTGLDFGFTNDPTAVIDVYLDGHTLILHERLYSTGLTNPDIGEELDKLDVETIIADSAELFDSVNKTVTIPENLYDITVDQYLQIQAIPEGDELEQVVRTICILCHLEREEVMGMEQKDIQHIGGVIGGILDKYDDTYHVERIIELDQRYGFHPNLSRITVAEFADIETLCKDSLDKHLPQVMGILYRPIVEEHGEFYRIADYDGEDRSEYFREMKMAHALGAAAFFLRTATVLADALDSYSKAVKNPSYPRNTDGSPRSYISQGRTLLNYRRSKGLTSRRRSPGSPTNKTGRFWKSKN
jgi:PBSX family phage terminase large subunit